MPVHDLKMYVDNYVESQFLYENIAFASVTVNGKVKKLKVKDSVQGTLLCRIPGPQAVHYNGIHHKIPKQEQ